MTYYSIVLREMEKTTYHDNVNPAAVSILDQCLPLLGYGRGSTILEFGCSTGALGSMFKQRYPELKWIGFDYNPTALTLAANRLDKVHKYDLNSLTTEYLNGLGLSPSLLVLVDVLEHVNDPWSFVKILKQAFSTSLVLCVLPNIACYQTYDRLSQHDFPYEEFGIFDKTHKTFYTAKSALSFFGDLCYSPVTGPIFLPDPVVSILLSEKVEYPFLFRRNRYTIELANRDELISLCSYGFGFLFSPT